LERPFAKKRKRRDRTGKALFCKQRRLSASRPGRPRLLTKAPLGEFGAKITRAKDILLAGDGTINNDIQVSINGDDRVQREDIQSRKLSEGDTITFILLVAGG
jgi:hypothetical protein